MELFAERLQKMRERRRISRGVMSELCGLSKSVISKYERGERQPKLETLILLADFFECSIDYLVGRSDYPG
jgi:transcriptional regulator with XRE-family HTH domain